MFKKILIANRGECAIRIIRACQSLGISNVAIFSDIDRRSLHVLLAEEAYKIGPAIPKESYLNINKIIEVAKKAKVDAIHPGYGFLSENPVFAKAVEDAGICFIGPTINNIKMMGNKIEAKKLMKKIGVPTIPGSENPINSLDDIREIIKQIGLPVIIKAAAGGGGRGMRIVHDLKDLEQAYKGAKSEGLNYFKDGTLYVERFISNPKHIEVQVFADNYGNVIHIFDRECSMQRRHQKIIEECPSPSLSDNLRITMCELAVKASKELGYQGAGTFEFIFDNDTKEYFFMEMNTRLQVEHTITEAVTGIDIVEEQILVAAGNPLGMKQNDVRLRGCAIEARICAEDPVNYVPSPGKIRICWHPRGPFIRVDSAAYSDYEVPLYYDSMITKIIAWGHNRREAIQRLKIALTEFVLTGIKSNIVLHKAILDHPKFLDGTYTTQFIENDLEISSTKLFKYVNNDLFLITAAITAYNERKNKDPRQYQIASRWKNNGRKIALRI